MSKLQQLIQQQNNYIFNHADNGGSSEFDKSCNDISRDIIQAIKAEFGKCWVIKVNLYSDEGDRQTMPVFVEYTGQEIYNFSCDLALPKKDKELEQLVRNYWTDNYRRTLSEQINAIFDRAEEIGGYVLTWS